MARFRCANCGEDGEFVYDPTRSLRPGRPTATNATESDVRLWILSDLHLELTRGWDLPPEAERPQFDVMVVAGDLIPKMERGALWLLERVPDKPIIYIAGNHEGYGADVDRTVEKAMKIAEGTNLFIPSSKAFVRTCDRLDRP
jgi:hypothetical protein